MYVCMYVCIYNSHFNKIHVSKWRLELYTKSILSFIGSLTRDYPTASSSNIVARSRLASIHQMQYNKVLKHFKVMAPLLCLTRYHK